MKSYLRIFLLSLQTQLQYRMNLFGWILVNLAPMTAFLLIWLVILGDKSSLGGYTRNDFIFYYLFTTLSWYIVGGNFNRAVGDAIKNGEINKGLLKPYNVIVEKALLEQGWKVMSLAIMLPIFLIIIWIFGIQVDLTLFEWILVSISLFLGALLFAFFEAIVGMSAFWITENFSIGVLAEVMIEIFGGRIAPLTLLPVWVQTLSLFLPFKYMFYVPVAILTGKSANPLFDVFLQGIVVCITAGIYSYVWKTGIKRYEAIGG